MKPMSARSVGAAVGYFRVALDMMKPQPLGCCATTGLLFALCPCDHPVPWVIWLRPRKA